MHLISRKVKVGRPILAPSSGLSPAPPTSYAAQFAWQLLSLTCTLNNSRHIVWVNLPVSHVRLFVLCVCVCVCVCVLIYPPPFQTGRRAACYADTGNDPAVLSRPIAHRTSANRRRDNWNGRSRQEGTQGGITVVVVVVVVVVV